MEPRRREVPPLRLRLGVGFRPRLRPRLRLGFRLGLNV